MKTCFSEATSMSASFAEDVTACAEVAAGIDVWLTKLENHLATADVADARKRLADVGVVPAAASYQGGLLLSQGDARKAHFDHFRRRLELCQAVGIDTLVVAADFTNAIDRTSLERAVVSLAQAGQWAAGFGVRLALEFRATDVFCTSLDTAVRLAAACGESNVGVCLDTFHFFKGPSKESDLNLLTPANLFFVQVSDWSGVPRELASDADRIFPGDGDLPLAELLGKVGACGYDGWVSVELMNPTLWQLKPGQVAEMAMAALERILPARSG